VQQADGKLVVAGSSEGGPPFTETLVRYRANGRLDRSFGGGTGTVTTAFGPGAAAKALVQQSDGKLVAAGSGGVGSPSRATTQTARSTRASGRGRGESSG